MSPDLRHGETSVVRMPRTGKSLLSGPGGTFFSQLLGGFLYSQNDRDNI